MEVYVEPSPVYISAARLVLAAVGPAQSLIQSPALTHYLCNQQSLRILYNDGYQKQALYLSLYLDYLNKGVDWADSGFKNMSHFFHPQTNKGLYGWTNAIRECNIYWNKALRNWQNNSPEKALFFIGAAIHLVQDLCVPHHALGVLFDGHHDYEEWVEKNRTIYKVEKKGRYNLGDKPVDWLTENALIASEMYPLVRLGESEQRYHEATLELLPRAQRVTAGFLLCFLESALRISKTNYS